MNNFKDILEAYSPSKTCKIVREYTVKCSQLISSSDNKKILLTTKNVRLDSGTDFLIDGRRIKLFGFLRITTGGLGLGAQLTPRGRSFDNDFF